MRWFDNSIVVDAVDAVVAAVGSVVTRPPFFQTHLIRSESEKETNEAEAGTQFMSNDPQREVWCRASFTRS